MKIGAIPDIMNCVCPLCYNGELSPSVLEEKQTIKHT